MWVPLRQGETAAPQQTRKTDRPALQRVMMGIETESLLCSVLVTGAEKAKGSIVQTAISLGSPESSVEKGKWTP